MFKTSHLQELKRRYVSMYATPAEKEVIEDGTIEGVNQYKKDTPGQDIEKEFKEHNTIGVLGELIAQHFFIEQGAYFEATEILLLLNILNECICSTSLLLAPEVSTTLAPFVAV